jgi:hypothetical protein
MILSLATSAARVTALSASLVLAASLSYFSIRNAFASYHAELGTQQGYEQAVRLEPSNPFNWFLLGRFWQYNLDNPDAARAVASYRTALSLNPRSADAWLNLGTTYELEGDLDNAREAYLQAKRVYPLSAEVCWRYGNFLLRRGQIPTAFAEIRQSLALDPQRATEAFSRCWRVDPDIDAILDSALPPNGSVYLAAIHELGESRQIGAALSVWARLVAIHAPVKLPDVFRFADLLVQANEMDDAQRVWNDALRLSETPPPPDPPGSLLWDGGFETGILGGGFTWRIPPPAGGVKAALTSQEKHSGKHSLGITFDGKHNVNFEGVCHVAEVQPETPYRLSAWVRTQALTTDEGLRFRLFWRDSSGFEGARETPPVNGTQPWSPLHMSWFAPANVRQLIVCMVRHASNKLDNRIKGTVWIDDVVLAPQSPEQSEP